jgi:hypothetical protein
MIADDGDRDGLPTLMEAASQKLLDPDHRQTSAIP